MIKLVPAAIVLLAGLAVGAPRQAEAGAIPLVVSALVLHGQRAPRVLIVYAAHAASICAAMIVQMWLVWMGSDGVGAFLTSHRWAIGGGILLGLQSGRLRHPPAFASGCAVLAGLPACVLWSQWLVAASMAFLVQPKGAHNSG